MEKEKFRHRPEYFRELPGTVPGTLNVPSPHPDPQLVLIDYSDTSAMRVSIDSPEDCAAYLDQVSVSWLDVQGLGNIGLLQRLGEVFQLHPLVLEDVVNVPQRPKVESYGDQLVIIIQMVRFVPELKQHFTEQISFILGKHYLLTVQEEPEHDFFDPIRTRIRLDKGIIRSMGSDYLAYALLDAIIDGFFSVLEAYGEELDALEDSVISKPNQQTLQQVYQMKRKMSHLRHLIWLQRETLSSLLKQYSSFFSQELGIYLQDCYDHVVQMLDIVESYRETCATLMDVYLSAASNRMNEVMKTLTVISTIFIPLTFIAGIYGMNFNPGTSPFNMPELNAYWGYPLVLAVMLAIALGLVFFFWRRGWFKKIS
ncbi:magnesium/cobalt transporter CorA [Leptothoe sp. PORK10 BA2]|uniref:magnesium/cobalt transporter CorA n=1 Tax=Leptothoe sp. PORK10 BA2 TaxID=3110254 RepID=UPI002B20D109|nr:magnesium/cobalt transporter CorA [Leptothoe sp. PORK10 BA2]MEA5466677.1 magnesium/cobalt transporter CorA [Leptothoe sp. PORK10 BA2]